MRYAVGQRVRHRVGDLGTVAGIDDKYVKVRWDGYDKATAFFKRDYLEKHPDYLIPI